MGGVKGYKVKLFLPAQLSSEYNPADRIRIAKLYGCEMEAVDLSDYLDNADELDDVERSAAFVAIRMAKCYQVDVNDPSSWWSNQLCNQNNTLAHREGTGAEIVKQLDGKVDAWVASIGTGGTMLGVAQAVKAANPDCVVTGVLPTDDPRVDWVKSRKVHHYLTQFGAPEMRFIIEDILDSNILDHELVVENEDAKRMADRLCREEGLFCGMSSGANVYAAIQMAKQMEPGSNIVTVLVDRRDRYFAEYPHEHYIV